MAQVKVYGLQSSLQPVQAALSDAIHEALVSALELPADKRFQRFFKLAAEDFYFPSDRSAAYTIIEISMFEGRSTATKKLLIQRLFQLIEQRTGIVPQDIEITLFETPKHHWGIRGLCADELQLHYSVNI